MTTRRPLDRVDAAVAAWGFAGTLGVLLATARDIGYARDEGFYILASRAYGRWLQILWTDPSAAVSPAVVDVHFAVNSEHPPLLKLLFALSHDVLHTRLGLFAVEGTSVRFPAMVLAAALVALLYLWGAQLSGRIAGAVAALSFVAMPRVFFHAHLACFDVPVTALFTATVYAWWRATEERSARPAVACALLFGLTLATKHNAWFLPILFAAHAAVMASGAGWCRERVWGAARRPLGVLTLCLVVGPLVLYALWPWIWRHPIERLGAYVVFHTRHEFYNMELLGQTYWRPPFPRLYAPLMTLATVSTTTLALASVGAYGAIVAGLRALLRRDGAAFASRSAAVLCLGGVLVSYGPWTSAETPIFGGTKHWMTAYPFIALFCGLGLARAAAHLEATWPALRHRIGAAGLRLGLAALTLAPGALTTARSTPWGLTAYVPLVGGAPGAATLGLNRTFWGTTTASAAPWLDAEVPKGARVYAHDTLGASWDQLQDDGTLRGDLQRVSTVTDADIALQHHEMHMQGQEYQAWVALGTTRPALVLGPDGVPVVLVYRKGGRRGGEPDAER